jgi:hypothetical protein
LFLSGWVYEEGVNRAMLCRASKILTVFFNKNPAKDFCFGDLDGVVVVVVVVQW